MKTKFLALALMASTAFFAQPAFAAVGLTGSDPVSSFTTLQDGGDLMILSKRGRGRGADDGTADEGPNNADDGPDDDEDGGVHQCRGCDDGPNHTFDNSGEEPMQVARRGRGRGADDGPGHVRRGRGADDGPGHIRRGRGADDNDGSPRQCRGCDDGPNHTMDNSGEELMQMARRGRGADDGAGDDRRGRGRGTDDGPNHT